MLTIFYAAEYALVNGCEVVDRVLLQSVYLMLKVLQDKLCSNQIALIETLEEFCSRFRADNTGNHLLRKTSNGGRILQNVRNAFPSTAVWCFFQRRR